MLKNLEDETLSSDYELANEDEGDAVINSTENEEGYDADITRLFEDARDKLDARCGSDGVVAATVDGGVFVDSWTQLYIPFFYRQGVSLRAGTLIHESRHADGKDHDRGNKDSSWAFNGAWRWQVAWLSGFANEGKRTSIAMKTEAKQRANNIINTRFETNPEIRV